MTPSKPSITHVTRALPFDQLPWDDFERLCLMLLPRAGFENPQHYGAAGGEQGRDIVATRDSERWYVQCKQVKRCGPKVLLDEIEKVRKLVEIDPDLRTTGMLFMVSCVVHATARDRATKRCNELGLACEVWGCTDLDSRVQQHSDIVRIFFGWQPARPFDVPFQAPPLPAHFVPRPEVSDELKVRLLADEATVPGTLVVSAVHGLGGIGKTTLAAYLAYDLDIQARFPDGILWATLGQEPDVLSLLAGWIQTLGDYEFHPTTIEMVSPHLRTLLHDKACLLVVDDAWQADHARGFLVSGKRCRVLVTTRDATLARKVGARLYDLNVMTEAQALALFETQLGPLDGDQDQAKSLACELGYLPLALELAAAQVEGGVTWAELLDVFRQRLTDLAALDLDEATYRNESLRLSFRLSLDRLSLDDQEAFTWLGVLPEDVRLKPILAATLWDQSELEARRRLRRFRNKALLRPVGDDCYTLHDLLHDEAKLRLVEQKLLPEAHAVLLERYRQKVLNERWDRLPDDGYINEHLVWHMGQAGQFEAIHALLRLETEEGGNAWHEAREALGQTASYMNDVHHAWRLVEHPSLLQRGIKERGICEYSEDIGLQCRYALITASLSNLARSIPPALLASLVKNKVWTSSQGLACIQQMSDVAQQANALVGIIPYLQEEEKTLSLQEIVTTAQKITSEDTRVQVLATLAPYESKSKRADALRTAFAAVLEMPDENIQARLLIDLAPHLPERLLGEAVRRTLERAGAITSRRSRAEALAGLALLLTEPDRSEVLREALIAARQISSLEERIDVLYNVAPYLPDKLFDRATAAARKIWQIEYRAEALIGLVPYLPKSKSAEVLDRVLTELHELRDQSERARTLVRALHRLLASGRADSVPRMLMIVQGVRNEPDLAEALTSIAPHLLKSSPLDILKGALATECKAEAGHKRSKALTGLALQLTELGHPQTALAAIREIRDQDARTMTLASLASFVPGSLSSNSEIRVTDDIAQTTVELISHLPEPDRTREAKRALIELRHMAVQESETRAKILISLAPHLSGRLLRRALSEARRIYGYNEQALALAGLAPYLPEPLVRKAVKAARKFPDEYARALALAGLAPYLPVPERREVIQEALAAIRENQDKEEATSALASLVPCLPESQRTEIFQEALAAVQTIKNEEPQVVILSKLAPYLPRPLLREARAIALRIKDKRWRAEALRKLIPHFAPPEYDQILREALGAIRMMESKEQRSELLTWIALHLTELQERDLRRLWQETLGIIAARSRRDLLSDLSALAPVIHKLGGDEAVTETIHAIQDVGRWWP